MVALSTLLAFTALANGAAHLQPYAPANEPQLVERELVQRDIFADLQSFFSSIFAGAPKTTSIASTATSITRTTSKPASTSAAVTVKTSGTAVISTIASNQKPVSTASTSTGSGTGASSLRPASSSAPSSGNGTGASSVKPASSSAPSSGNGAGASSVKPASSSAPSSGNGAGASSVKPASSAGPSSGNGSGASSAKPVSSSGPSSGNGSGASSAKPASSSGPSSGNGTGASSIKPSSSSKPSSAVASGTGVKSSAAAPSSTRTSSSTSVASSSASQVQSSSPVVASGPTVSASAGTFIGDSYSGVDQWLAIPYAQPPVGQLRFKPPQPLTTSLGTFQASTPPLACPQIAGPLTGNYSAGGLQPLFDKFIYAPTNQSEDCLTINIFRPNTTTPTSKLPVIYWMYGGAFQFGSTSMYNGTGFVARSVAVNSPVIFVEVNYRLGGFGFLHGADLAAEHSTNLGLRDQRLGLEWVADNIESFGGDSSKVTLWGESAGSISAANQLVIKRGDNTYKGKPLFRASIHDSGAFAPAENGTAPQAQAIYDGIVSATGCTASTAAARLSCLRSVDYDTLVNATRLYPGFGSYTSCDLPYLPRTDDSDPFYNFSTVFAIPAGYWTKTPFIIGDQEDEGTLLAITLNNVTTNDQVIQYLASWFPGNKDAVSDVTGLVNLYPDDPSGGQPDGSPFFTGSSNNLWSQYKRLAAILGDIVFTLSRRGFLSFATGQGVPAWSYLAIYLRGLATFGTLHASDLAYLFDSGFTGAFPTQAILTHYISFAYYLDPNQINTTQTATYWPQWTKDAPALAEWGPGATTIGNDTFRSDVYNYLVSHVFGFEI